MIQKIHYWIYKHIGNKYRNLILDYRAKWFYISYIKFFRFKRAKNINTFYFVIDPKFKHHPGLADRLKAIIGCYYIAKTNGYKFKIIDMQDNLPTYLTPSKINWLAKFEEIEYSLQDTRLLAYSASACNPNFKLRKNKQYQCHIYRGDDLFYQNGFEYQNTFHILFNELFAPSKYIKDLINQIHLTAKEYIAVHIRFVNALEAFESSRYPTLSASKAEALIKRCLEAINIIIHEEKLPVVVFSDSKYFLERVKETKAIVIGTDNITHMSFNNSKEALSKMYIDFFLISQAAKTYRLLAKELRETNFSVYASLAGESKFEDKIV